MCVLVLTFTPSLALAEERSESPILLMTASEVVDNRVEIVATLARNSGILGMTLTLNYDTRALTLVQATDGAALSNLSKVHSGKLSTVPYKINYMWKYYENDYSKGVLLTFVFEVNEDAKNGTYEITLLSERNGVQYLDEDDKICYKNIVAETASVTVKGEDKSVEILPPDENNFTNPPDNNDEPNNILPIVIPVSIIAVLLVVLVVILVLKKGRSKK